MPSQSDFIKSGNHTYGKMSFLQSSIEEVVETTGKLVFFLVLYLSNLKLKLKPKILILDSFIV